MSKKILVAGHICLDITPAFPGAKVNRISDVLSPGKLIYMKEADVHTGGCVANTGLAMKFFGADVSLVSKIGDDPFGEMLLHILRKHHAEESMIVTSGESTAYSVILAIPGVDRVFLHNPGANDTFVKTDIPKKLLKNVVLFHFGYPPLMKQMYQAEGAELLKMMKYMKENGIATSMDMTSVDPNSTAGKTNWKVILEKVLPYVDFFVPSVEELCYMLDRERYEQWQERAAGGDIAELLDWTTDIKPLADRCMDFGAKVLLIKCGVLGMYYRTAGKEELQKIGSGVELKTSMWANKEGFEKSYVPDQVLSGTGAGDTSIAAFLIAVLDGYSIEECMQLATATGASCVTAYDALSGLKSFEELREKISLGWKKNGE